ncbi:carbamoyl phosphate synthase small subunit, partial [Treponema sp.]|uniref:carbamoyl phosphate synthase small subunit n=1 Tax=Treponema sp. TaxID=166 RepID=UPI0038904628
LKTQNIVGICGIDTRALTKKLREAGVMNGMIVSGKEAVKIAESCQTIQKPELNIADTDKHRLTKTDDQKLLNEIREYKIEDAVKSVQKSGGDFKGQSPLGEGVAKIPERSGEGRACSDFSGVVRGIGARGRLSPTLIPKFSVCLIDFGAKANIQRELEKRGCTVTVVPYNTTAKEIIELSPDGIMLSNGPGDPAENTGVIEEIRKLCEYGKIPIFGICLGHQMLALARGAQTQKLKYGHRGGNHPCKNLETGRVYITSQNHGYAVKTENLPSCAKLSFINSNDGTCEGIKYTDIPAFSVQFHPEACGGPHDTNFLFDDFVKMMEKNHASK